MEIRSRLMLRIAAARDRLEALVGAHFNKQALFDDGVLRAAPFLQQPARTLYRLGGHMKTLAVALGQLASRVARFCRRRLSVRQHVLPQSRWMAAEPDAPQSNRKRPKGQRLRGLRTTMGQCGLKSGGRGVRNDGPPQAVISLQKPN